MDPRLICIRCKGANILQEASVMLPVNHFDGPLMTRDELINDLNWSDLYYCKDCEDFGDVTDYIPQDEGETS
jgi:hypothetical protein